MDPSAGFLLLLCALFFNRMIWTHLKAQHAAVGHVVDRGFLPHTVQTMAGWVPLPGYYIP